MSAKYEDNPCECGCHYIQNRTKWKCSECVYKMNHKGKSRQEVAIEREKGKPKKVYKFKRKPLKRKPIKIKPRKPTGEYKLFLKIWKKRKHECHNCKMGLDRFVDEEGNPSAGLFMHMTSKGADCRLRLKSKNIELGCPECHDAYDHVGKAAYVKRKNLYKNEQVF